MEKQSVFAIRLKNARIMKGYSMDELCLKMGSRVSKMTISKYENGTMEPNSTNLIALANALEQSTDYFFRPFSVQIGAVEFRKKSSLGTKLKEQIRENVADALERYLNIEEICSESQAYEMMHFKVSSMDEAKSAAQKLREQWQLGIAGISNVIGVLESHGFKVIEVDAVESFDGLSTVVNGNIPVIVLKKRNLFERKRFTALHELGHLLFDFGEDVLDKKKETLCHAFANEMLIPESELKRILGASRKELSLRELEPIQRSYGISCDALVQKAYECGIITEQRFKGYRIYKNKNPWYKALAEKSDFPAETSSRFFSLVVKALDTNLITISKAASLLGVSIEQVRKEVVTAW